MKKVLVVHYSQSGQLTDILSNITHPLLNEENIEITSLKIEMEEPYPFPWIKESFFDVFPESFLQKPAKIKQLSKEVLATKFDLIILGYQVWYLSPSVPTNSFLSLPEVKSMLANTEVITVIGCRNMWIMAQEKVKKLLLDCNAKLVGNIALVDRHINHVSVITIVQWMFTGVKKKYLGFFPKPGVSEKDINESVKFGETILSYLKNDQISDLQSSLLEKGAVVIKPFLILVDKRANILFGKWAKLIASKGVAKSNKRKPWLKMFNFYLLFAIWIIAPIVFILFLLTYIPMLGKIRKEKEYYSSIAYK